MKNEPFTTREFYINIKCKVIAPDVALKNSQGVDQGITVGGNFIRSQHVTAEDLEKFFVEHRGPWWMVMDSLFYKGIEVEFEGAE